MPDGKAAVFIWLIGPEGTRHVCRSARASQSCFGLAKLVMYAQPVGGRDVMIGHSQNGRQGFSVPAAITLFACAFAILAWPWLSGHVTIPWDAKAQFHPQLQFLAASLASGESPFWTPNVFSGWPQIADPQSLIFSPLHFLLALATPRPSFWAADVITFAMLFVGGVSVIAFFRDRGWHVAGALVAALVFCF